VRPRAGACGGAAALNAAPHFPPPPPPPCRTLTRSPEKSLEIQAYAKAKFDSAVVVDALLAFSIDVMAKAEAAAGKAKL